MKTKFGKDWTEGSLTFPKHLTPEIIHSALFVYNAEDKEQINYITDMYKKNFDFVINSVDENFPQEIFERRLIAVLGPIPETPIS